VDGKEQKIIGASCCGAGNSPFYWQIRQINSAILKFIEH
jgi:hypothetical protein